MAAEQGKITYRKLTISESEASDVAAYLNYREEGRLWYVYRIPRLKVAGKEKFEAKKMQVYLPTYTVQKQQGGKIVTEEKPKILDYLFVLATPEQVEKLAKEEAICPVYRHRASSEWEDRMKKETERRAHMQKLKQQLSALKEKSAALPKDDPECTNISHECTRLLTEYRNLEKHRPIEPFDKWATVPFAQMHALMIIVQGFETEVEFCTPDDQLLEKGDSVRITGGKFKGVEGTLLTRQGASGGYVYIQVTNSLIIKTAKIRNEYIQVLAFSRNTNHFYYKIAAFEKRIEACLQCRKEGHALSEKQKAELKFFLFRYERLASLTSVNAAKLLACRYAAYKLLGQNREAARCLKLHAKEQERTRNNRRAAKRASSAQDYIDKWFEKVDAALLHLPDQAS